MANALTLPEPQFNSGINFAGRGSGIQSILQGIFGNSASPYESGANAYGETVDKYLPEIRNNFAPYQNYGASALPAMNESYGEARGAYGNAKNSLSRMSDPEAFLNSILSKYSESPGAAFERQAGNKGITNAASASGMLGSGALMKSAAQYNQQLTSKDMQQFLENILGINKDYISGEMQRANGLNSLGTSGYGQQASMGLNASSSLASLIAQILGGQAEAEGNAAYGAERGDNADFGSTIGGLAKLFF